VSEHSAEFIAAKKALSAFAATLDEGQRASLNGLVATFVGQAVRDYKAKRDRAEEARENARRTLNNINSRFRDIIDRMEDIGVRR
jgi:uncharacterized protein YukE